MTEYVYRVVDQDGAQILTNDERLTERDARWIAKKRNYFADHFGNGRSYRVQRAAVVWEAVDNV